MAVTNTLPPIEIGVVEFVTTSPTAILAVEAMVTIDTPAFTVPPLIIVEVAVDPSNVISCALAI